MADLMIHIQLDKSTKNKNIRMVENFETIEIIKLFWLWEHGYLSFGCL